jgi:hypothetical protein
MTTDTPILAIACGPIVTTWDIAKSTTSQHSNFFSAPALAGTGTGIEQFKPHGNNNVNDLAWNHNGQGKMGNVVSMDFSLVGSLDALDAV